MIFVVPAGTFPPCGGTESIRNGCACASGKPISKIKSGKKSNNFILHEICVFVI